MPDHNETPEEMTAYEADEKAFDRAYKTYCDDLARVDLYPFETLRERRAFEGDDQ